MAALGCLIKDTRIIQDIKEVLQIVAADAINNGKRFSLNTAYKFLRDNDIEIDLESTGSIYANSFDLSDDNFSTSQEIEEITGKSFEDTLNNLVEMTPQNTVEQIGTLSPGKQVARKVVNIFRNAFVTDTKTQTLMRKFQDALTKAAKRMVDNSALPEQVKQQAQTFEDILGTAFELDQHGFRTISGAMNGVEDVWKEFKNEVGNYIEEMRNNGADEATIDAFDNYTNKLITAGYNIFLSQKEAQDVLKGALIEAGFKRETTIKGQTKTVLDWKKLAGIGGDVDLMRKNVTTVLSNKGFTDQQISRVNDALTKEYVDLKSSIIEKAANELKRRNEAGTNVQQKSAARRLAELYTFGLFNAVPGTYQNITNKLFGLNDIDQKTFAELQELGKALQTLYSTSYQGQDLNESHLRTHIKEIEDRIDGVLTRYSNDKSTLLKIARVIQSYIELGQRFVLNNIRNLFQNRLSNWFALLDAKAGYRQYTNKELRNFLKTLSSATYKDIHVYGGGSYGQGDTSTFINKGSIDRMFKEWGDKFIDPKAQARFGKAISLMVGREGLEAMDSFYKSKISELYLIKNLVRILTDPTNPNKISKQEAINYISEQLTGQKFADAKKVAKDTIEKINSEAGKNIVNNNEAAITRFAADIVKAQLVIGGKLTEEQLSAANNSAYKAAGRDLGHVANNILSSQLQKVSKGMEERTTKHIRNREYRAAAFQTLLSIGFRNVLNPFVGGATNWIVLGLEKTGLGLITGGANILLDKRSAIDIENDTTKDIEDKLFRDLKAKNKMLRGAVGGATSAFVWLMMRSMGGCEATTNEKGQRVPCGFEAWRKNNRWASRYTDLLTPELFLAELASKSGNTLNYVQNYFGNDDKFSKAKMLTDAFTLFGNGENNQAWGRLGDLVGQPLNTPLPWRPFKDMIVLTQGFRQMAGANVKPFTYDYSMSKGFFEGVTKGGFLEWKGWNYKGSHHLDDLPGVGGKNLQRLHDAGIYSIQDLKDVNLRRIKYKDSKGRDRSIFNEEQRDAVESIIKNEVK